MLPQVGALALEPDQPALVDQHVDRQPDGVAGHPVLLLQHAFDRQWIVDGELADRDPAAQISREPLVLGGLGTAPWDCHPSECSDSACAISAKPANIGQDWGFRD